MSYVIIVKDELFIFLLSNIGVFLYGVKFVFVDEGVEVFYLNKVYVIIGSFMKVINNDMMVVVICWYVVKKEGFVINIFMCYIIIENLVVKFG